MIQCPRLDYSPFGCFTLKSLDNCKVFSDARKTRAETETYKELPPIFQKQIHYNKIVHRKNEMST